MNACGVRVRCVGLGLLLVACVVAAPAMAEPSTAIPTVDGIALDQSVTPAQLKAMPQHFTCVAQDGAGRFQVCLQEVEGSQSTVVVLLDGRVGALMQIFEESLADEAVKWSIAIMGTPKHRKFDNGRTDLKWEGEQNYSARLLTGLQDMAAHSAFSVITKSMTRYFDENPDPGEGVNERGTHDRGITPSRCLAMPLLCPTA